MPACDVRFTCPAFAADLKALEKKHPRIRDLLEKAIAKVLNAPEPIAYHLKGVDSCWKIRVTDDFRLIYHFKAGTPAVLIPIALYAKNDRADVPSSEIGRRLAGTPE